MLSDDKFTKGSSYEDSFQPQNSKLARPKGLALAGSTVMDFKSNNFGANNQSNISSIHGNPLGSANTSLIKGPTETNNLFRPEN